MRTWKATVGLMLAATLSATGVGAQTADNVANTSQKGSLLIWPEVDNFAGARTLIQIHNDNTAAIDVKCYWLNGQKDRKDFSFKLTKKQPVYFFADTGRGSINVPFFPQTPGTYPQGNVAQGTLVCWAVDATVSSQVNFNHLAGSATVFEGTGGIHEYNTWAFKARTGNPGAAIGDRELKLDGVQYDACPQYIHGTYLTDAWPAASRLYVTSCNQDLRQDYVDHFTKLEFIVWNEQEVKATGAYKCIDSWDEAILAPVVQFGGRTEAFENLTSASLGTLTARYKVTGVQSTQCSGSEAAGLLGIQQTTFAGGETTAANVNTAGRFPGYVRWDPNETGPVPEKR